MQNDASLLPDRVQWCPNSSVNAYAVGPQNLRVFYSESSTAAASLSSQSSDLRCMDWNISGSLIAAGTSTGRAALIPVSLDSKAHTTLQVVKELIPRYSRPCNAVGFNPIVHNHLAVGLEKVRNANCALIWDVNCIGHTPPSTPRLETEDNSNLPSPLVDFSQSEAVNCLSWIPDQPFCVAVGAGLKWLRLYDLRSPTEAVLLGTHPKSVQGVLASPFHSHHLVSYSEDGMIKLWDCRKPTMMGATFSPNIFSMHVGGSSVISCMEWSPSKEGILAVTISGESSIRLYDLYSERKGKYDSRNLRMDQVISFSYHREIPNRLVLLDDTGEVTESRIYERFPITWSPLGDLLAADSDKIISQEVSKQETMEISQVMRKRAFDGYGLNYVVNAALFDPQSPLGIFWNWFQYSVEFWKDFKRPAADNSSANKRKTPSFPPTPPRSTKSSSQRSTTLASAAIDTPLSVRIIGILNLLSGNTSKETSTSFGSFVVFESAERNLALKLLGWWSLVEGETSRESINQHLSTIPSERATALSVFHLNLQLAVSFLTNSSRESPYGSLVAMALSGYANATSDRSLWMNTCDSLRAQIYDPYLRSVFAFLCSRGSFTEILSSESLLLSDRIAFACRFLSDASLTEYLETLLLTCSKKGDLNGLTLTGLSTRAYPILEGYISQYVDLQTVAIISSFVKASVAQDKLENPEPCSNSSNLSDSWIDSYRKLLDRWKMWDIRAKFDHDRNRLGAINDTADLVPVFPRCGYCNHPFSLPANHSASSNPLTYSNRPMLSGMSRMMGFGAISPAFGLNSMSNSASRITFCTNCKKSLPRCSICLIPISLNTGSSGHPSKPSDQEQDSKNVSEWIVWCQNCRHGGHCGHLLEWFSMHSECPVSDCNCPCGSF